MSAGEALDVDAQRAFVNYVRLWWSGPHGYPVVAAGNDSVVADDFEDMTRELAALGLRVARLAADTEPEDQLRGSDRSMAEHSDSRSACPECGEWRDSPTADCAACGSSS